ncbi:MAG: GNAT family N-acetyltransferase [Novosphingobium sp.]|nr:GNAT family N-acetyltransferase [Novosphingobium sp.]
MRTTERLELWRPQIADRAGLLALMAPGAVRKFLGPAEASETDVFARQLRNAGSWALYGYGVFTLRERGGDEIVGTCGVFRSFRGFGRGMDDVPEAGWIIAEPSWGKGYAREAMTAALAWFDREHEPQRVACMIEESHAASMTIAAKLGFVEYARHEPEGERALVLYQRMPPS